MDISLRVLKEPRGFIRVIQCIMAILAFSMTAGFSTECEFKVKCDNHPAELVEYEVGYPFSMSDNVVKIPKSCEKPNEDVELILPFDYSNAAEFFVATGVLSFLYTILALVIYIFFHQIYSNDPKLPVIDLGVTAILSVFWLAGSSAWAQGVTDLKYYLHPETLFKVFTICAAHDDNDNGNGNGNGNGICDLEDDGSYGILNASLILGFANFLLWAASLWFIYKETVFHTPDTTTQTTQNQAPKDIGRV